MALLAETAQSVDIPISAVGGVSSWRDVVEYIMLGATTVQLATSVMWKGWGIVQEILDGLAAYMDEKGYKSIEDFRGKALPYITTVEELCQEPALKAEINQDLCTNCGTCHRACFMMVSSGMKATPGSTRTIVMGVGFVRSGVPKEAITLK